MAIPYVKQTWTDGSGGGTPVSAARLGVEEQGILDAHYMPAARVFHNTTQSITSGVLTALAFNSERFDQASNVADTMHDTVTNNSRLTCRYAGVYQISGNIEWPTAAGTVRVIAVRLNGVTQIAQDWIQSTAGVSIPHAISTLYSLTVNDYVELMVSQNSGGAVNVNSTGNYSPEFMFVRVG